MIIEICTCQVLFLFFFSFWVCDKYIYIYVETVRFVMTTEAVPVEENLIGEVGHKFESTSYAAIIYIYSLSNYVI